MNNNITFKQFIYAYNFRCYNDNQLNEQDKYDTNIIRIYYPLDDFKINTCWIEFGIDDFSNKDVTWRYCCNFLKEDILNSYIDNIEVNDNIIRIYLTKNEIYEN